MKKTIYTKLIFAYLIFAFFGFVVVASFISNMVSNLVTRTEAENLYKEAILIADTYATDLYNSETGLDTVKRQLDSLGTYLDATLWIMNPSGLIVLSSDLPVDVENPVIVEGFNAANNSGNYYVVSKFYDMFSQDVLSVFAPITDGFQVKGYVIIHKNMININQLSNDLLNICYFLFLLLLSFSGLVLCSFGRLVVWLGWGLVVCIAVVTFSND